MIYLEEEFQIDNVLDVIVNYGLIIRARNPNVDVVYQRYSFSKLYIKEEGDILD